ncbi:TrmH family RNA methyltransferase [Patescibacteria group bacterium]|nr:TrmH family RNA methyltransferase [Patescibacteria group bacterium]
MVVIAHNIRSLYNVGSIFRNAAAFGIEKLYLTGYTATPPRKEISKVALGAEELVDWKVGKIGQVIDELKKAGYKVYGLEIGGEVIKINQIHGQKVALVLGNEIEGIDQITRSKLDGLIEIPMAKNAH